MQIHNLILIAPFILGSVGQNSLPNVIHAPAPKPPPYHVIAPIPVMAVPVMPAPQPLEPVAPPSLPVATQGTYINGYAFGNCTAYVAGRKHLPDSWGNAANWAVNAAAQGITVSSAPRVGAIAQRAGGLGHVAIVLEFTGTQVHITEMNSVGLGVVDDRWQPISTYNYIYI